MANRRTSAMNAIFVGFLILGAGCSSGGVNVVEVKESESGTLQIVTKQCADDVTVEVAETATAVNVSDVDGRRLKDSDCLGVVWVELGGPLGDREVIVDGEQWLMNESGDGFVAPS